MRIAVAGCVHGQLSVLYDSIKIAEEVNNYKVDLVLLTGDVQTLRDQRDLSSMNVPDKYKCLGEFSQYFAGTRPIPIPTIFVGGNHEASNYLLSLLHGGFVAPNLYYLGSCGVVRFGGLRIGGISGIYHHRHYAGGRPERPPFTQDELRSVYHTREYDIKRLLDVSGSLDIFLSHDWPSLVLRHGDLQALLRRKPHFRRDVERGQLGSRPLDQILTKVCPERWFSSHMHTRFEASVDHGGGKRTEFLALDKCVGRRKFLEVLEVESCGEMVLQYDPEWIQIVQHYDEYLSFEREQNYPSSVFVGGGGGSSCIENWDIPVPQQWTAPESFEFDPQTTRFRETLGLADIHVKWNRPHAPNPDEIDLDQL